MYDERRQPHTHTYNFFKFWQSFVFFKKNKQKLKFSTTHAQIYVSFHNTLLRKIKKILNRPFTNDVNKTKQELPKRNK